MNVGSWARPGVERSITMTRFMALALAIALTGLATGCFTIDVSPTGNSSGYIETTFTVDSGRKHAVAVQLQAKSFVEGSFSISGAGDSVDFYVYGPNRELVYGVVRAVGGQSFKFQAENSGTHTLNFDNSISFAGSRDISLRYRVQ